MPCVRGKHFALYEMCALVTTINVLENERDKEYLVDALNYGRYVFDVGLYFGTSVR